jgi:two-component system response regulator AtoC
MISPHVLVVVSEPATLRSLNEMLASAAYSAEESGFGADALVRVCRDPAPDLVLLELGRGSGMGLPMLRQLRAIRPDLVIVVLSAAGNTKAVVEAIRLGAQDYLNVPLQEPELKRILLRYLDAPTAANESTSSNETLDELGDGDFFQAASPTMQEVRVQAELLANLDVPVLILGESGTGKEFTARLIHKLSSRSQHKFLKVNCAAFPGELLEGELLGQDRGIFAGAARTKPGILEVVGKGTILLDEVVEMPADVQAKLLDALHNKEYFRGGGENPIDVDARILAATNVNIHQAIAKHKFREDLYYKLGAFTIVMPPLRERQEEIPLLLHRCMERMAAQHSRPAPPLTRALIETCLDYSWPGNLTELETFVTRYLVMQDESLALARLRSGPGRKQVPVAVMGEANDESDLTEDDPEQARNLKTLVRNRKFAIEIEEIKKALAETNWNRTAAARLLNISYRGLLYKIRQHGIARLPGGESTASLSSGNVN